MGGEPFDLLHPIYAELMYFITILGDIIPDVAVGATKSAWTLISIFLLYRGIIFWRARKRIDERRKYKNQNGFRKIRSLMWLGLSQDFVHQALAASILGVIAVLTPTPVRSQLTLLQVASNMALIFIIWKSFMMVSRVNNADQDTIDYAKKHHPEIVMDIADDDDDYEGDD